MQSALVVQWTTPVAGREAAAIAYGREADQFWGQKASEGLCTQPKWYWGTFGDNFWMVEGDYGKLAEILATPEVQELMTKGSVLVQDFRYDIHRVGREEMFGTYEHVLSELKVK